MVYAHRIPSNACHPAVIEQARVLVTESLLSYPAIAWEAGVCLNTVLNWQKRYGWVRPPAKWRERGVVAAAEVARRPRRFSRGGRGKGRYYAPEVVEAVRRMVEESVLTQGAIAAKAGISHETIRVWTKRYGWVRPAGTTCAADGTIVTRHCERSEATQATSAIAEASWVASSAAPPRNDGSGDDGWRHDGWRDALLPPGFLLPQNRRASSGKGRPYMRPVVERVRELVEGTGLSQAAIAARTGVGSATVGVWMRKRGWRRPLDAYRSSRAVPADRAGLSARLAAGFARVAALVEEGTPSLRHAEERPASRVFPRCVPEEEPSRQQPTWQVASRSTHHARASFETPAARAPQDDAVGSFGSASQHDAVGGGPVPSADETAALVRLARNARRLARLYDRAGLARLPVPRRSFGGEPWEPVRLSVAPRGPRHHPRGDDVLAQARRAWEGGCETRETIARTLGIARSTLTRWAQTGGWIRPDGAHSPIGRPRNPGFRTRMGQRIEARLRLGEAEGMLEGFRHCERSEATQAGDAGGPWVASSAAPPRDDGSAALEAAFGLFRGAAEIVGRPLPTERDLETPRARRGRRVRPSGR